MYSFLLWTLILFQNGQKSYPLRPELIESTYWLFKATRNPRSASHLSTNINFCFFDILHIGLYFKLHMGEAIMWALSVNIPFWSIYNTSWRIINSCSGKKFYWFLESRSLTHDSFSPWSLSIDTSNIPYIVWTWLAFVLQHFVAQFLLIFYV